MYSGVPTTSRSGCAAWLGESSPRGLGDAEVDHLRCRLRRRHRDQDVDRLDVAMDDALVMCMLDRLTDRHQQLESFARRSSCVIAELVIGVPLTSSITKKGRPSFVVPRVEDLGDVGMIHQRQRLTLRLEAGEHRWQSMPGLMSFSATRRDASARKTTPVFADHFHEIIAPLQLGFCDRESVACACCSRSPWRYSSDGRVRRCDRL